MIVDKYGKDNLVAYFLSKVPIKIDADMVNDSFPNEHLFALSM